MEQPTMDFDGASYERRFDHARLTSQMGQVFTFIKDGDWHTLHGIEEATGHPQASISARLRDLRKKKFGGFNVQKRRVHEGSGTYEYILYDDVCEEF